MSVYRDVLLGRVDVPLRGGLSALLGPSEAALNFQPADRSVVDALPIRVVDELVCTVCMESEQEPTEARVLPCGHEYHAECVDPWLLTNKVCPMCRFVVQ